MTFSTITSTTSKSQEKTPTPLFNFIRMDNEKLDAIDKLVAEKVKISTTNTFTLQGRVNSQSSSVTSSDNDAGQDWDYDDDCESSTVSFKVQDYDGDCEDPLSSFTAQEFDDDCEDISFSFTAQDDDNDYEDILSLSKASLKNTKIPSTPLKRKKIPTTPEAIKTLSTVIQDQELGCTLFSDSKIDFDNALEKVNEKTSPYKEKDEIRDLFGKALEQTGSISQVPFSSIVKRRLFTANNYEDIMGGWTTTLATNLKFSFIDVNHLIDLERSGGGFHICGPDHHRDQSVIKRRTNVWTDVWCGQVGKEEKVLKEFSSFIPRGMSLEDYASLLSRAINTPDCKIAEAENRHLYKLTDENRNTFAVECYFQDGGTRIKSVIPIFQYEVYNGEREGFRIVYFCQETLDSPECIDTYDVTYEKLFELLKGYSGDAIIYNTEDKLIVDVGILFSKPNQDYGVCPIEKGVLVEIPQGLF